MNTTPSELSRRELVEANEQAAHFFRSQLLAPSATGPRSYLESRGFAHLLQESSWTVGFAPGGWTAVRDHLTRLGFPPEVLQSAGLTCATRRGGAIDRFRERLTFGIRDVDGNLAGFTARCAPGAAQGVPKYLNTPHTALYDKSSVLFGLGEQRANLRAGANLVLVEGPLDALAVDLLNDGNRRLAPLAACGTAVTTRHGEILGRLVRSHVIVAFDRDPAGLKAAERTCAAISGHLRNPFAAALPHHADPAETLVQEGPEGLSRCLTRLRPLAQAIVDEHLDAWPNLSENAEARVACLREVSRVLARLGTGDINTHATRLTSVLGLGQGTVTRELTDAVSAPPESLAPAATGRRQTTPVRHLA
ncbi:toprim domain-containing protein [Nocardioides ungokensis]|uniref:toprim domain-containing protein n=1 Tax=Nocardioides ungokensis TaxID=1643322 RepID=UPI0015DE2E4C|nr:toprim domain-containing protein [Nocardioides ungokensis]